MDMSQIMNQARQFQERMGKMQQELAGRTVTATVGGGMVTVVANGKQEIMSIAIEPEVVNADDIAMLQDLVVAAVNEAIKKAQEMARAEMLQLTGGMSIPGLSGLF